MLHKILWFALIPTAPLLAQESAPQGTVLVDNWTIMKMADAPVGYIHTLVKAGGTGDARRIHTKVTTRMTINRLGATLKIEQDSLTIEKGDGALVRMDSRTLMSGKETKSQVIFAGDETRLVTELMGRKRERKLNCPKGMVGPYRLQQLAVEHGFKAGTKWKAVTFVGDLQAASAVSNEVLGEEEITLADGQKRKLTKMRVLIEKMPVPATTWVDATGLPLRVHQNAAGIKMTMVASNKQDALAAVGAGEVSPDLFKETMIVAKEFLPFARRTTAAVVHVKVRDASLDVKLPSTRRQVVGKADAEGVITIQLSRVVPATGKTGTRPIASVPKALEESLKANTMIQSDEAEIIRIAKEIVGDEKDAWRAAQKIEAWVTKNLTNKGYGVGFASALEVCRNREGDCSEHAVLLAALCRASGIPARVCMGVLYVAGIWGGHAWNEVWIDGEWFALDATIGLGSVDALHLTMSSMNLQDGESGAELARMATVIGNLDVRVESLEYAGKTIRVADAVKVEGSLYSNRLWGFSCRAPEGFEHEPERPRAQMGYEVLEIEGKNSAGKRCEISVSIFGAQPTLNYGVLTKGIGRRAEKTKDIEVDGRKGQMLYMKRNGGHRQLVAVIDVKHAVYVFSLDRSVGAADEKMFSEFLGGADFDLSR